MHQNEFSEAVIALAESILRINFPDGLPGVDKATSDQYIQKFISQEISDYDTGRLTSENLVRLFERYCEFEQMKSRFQ